MARTQINASLIPTAQYLSKYRRPVLQWNSVTTVNVQDQIVTGITGDCTVLFTDGKLITVNNTTQTRFDITRNAVLSGSKQSGLRTGSEANNTWYALYAVRATDNDDTWVTVGDTVFPVNSSISTLNSNFGTDKWLYLGLIRNGDNYNIGGDILKFNQAGYRTIFTNVTSASATGFNVHGIRLATTASATVLSYSYSGGSGAAQIATNIEQGRWLACYASTTGKLIKDQVGTQTIWLGGVAGTALTAAQPIEYPVGQGLSLENGPGSPIAYDIFLTGFTDGALGVGSNPLV